MFQIRKRSNNHHLLSLAIGIGSALAISGCTQPDNLAAELYKKGQAAEVSKDWKQAEKQYLETLSAALESKSAHYHLASINRLTDVEVSLHNPSKAKSYMNQAATLAEKMENENKNFSGNEPLAREKHVAIMRLANWLFEDGNYVSARRLYGKAFNLEEELKIDPKDDSSAANRIKKLDALESFEHSQVSSQLGKNGYSTALRGPEAAHRAMERSQVIKDMQVKLVEFDKKGGTALAHQIMELLAKTRKNYGSRENEYRVWLKNVVSNLLKKGEFALLIPVLEADMKNFSNYSEASVDAAVPEAVENATFLTEDLIMLAEIKLYQNQWKEMLEICERAEQIAAKVVRKSSPLEYEMLLMLVTAQENNDQRVKALPKRKRQLEWFKKQQDNPLAYSEYLFSYGLDLAAAGRLDEAEAIGDEAYKIKRGIKGESHFESFVISYAELLIRLNKPDKARTVLLEALPYLQRSNTPSQLLSCYLHLSTVSIEKHPAEALEYNKRLQEIALKHSDLEVKYLMAQSILSCASLEIQFGKYTGALHTLDRGLEWEYKHGHELSAFTAGMWNGKANVYQHLRDWKQEKECRTKAIDICRRFNPPQPGPRSSTLFQAASQYQVHREFLEAERYLREAIEITEGKDEKPLKGMNLLCKSSLAICLFNSNKSPTQAANMKKEILPVYKKAFSGDQNSDITLCLALCELCVLLKDKPNARAAINQAELLYSKQKIKNKDILQAIHKQKGRLTALPH